MSERIPDYGPVTDYMTKTLITFKPETDIMEAILTIVEKQISGAPVVNDAGDLVGIISEKDCLRVLVGPDYHETPSYSGTVKDFMSAKVKTLTSDQSVLDAAYAFMNSNFRRFPVMEKGKLVGQVSRRDILRAVNENDPPKERRVPSSWEGREPA